MLPVYCPAGSTSPTAALCPTGRYRGQPGARSAADCEPCGLGQRCVDSRNGGSLYSVPCAAGEFSSVDNANNCSSCPAGYFSNDGTGKQTCTECVNGTYQKSPGRGSAFPASQARTRQRYKLHGVPWGYFSNVTTAEACHSCPVGTYQDTTAQASCLPCVPGSTVHQVAPSSAKSAAQHLH